MPRKKPTRKDKRFEYKITVGRNIHGKPLRKSFYSTVSLSDAKKKAEDSLAAASKALDAISDDVKKEEGIDNKIKKIKEVFDKIPAGVSSQNPSGKDADPYSDCRKDPVNNYFDE